MKIEKDLPKEAEYVPFFYMDWENRVKRGAVWWKGVLYLQVYAWETFEGYSGSEGHYIHHVDSFFLDKTSFRKKYPIAMDNEYQGLHEELEKIAPVMVARAKEIARIIKKADKIKSDLNVPQQPEEPFFKEPGNDSTNKG